MTTATPTSHRTSAAELAKTGDKRRNGARDGEDPEIDEKARLPRQQAAVAEATSHLKKESFLHMIAKTIASLHEWLAGPPTSAQDRVKNDIAEHQNWGHYGLMGAA